MTDDPDLSRAARDVVDENGVTLYHENLEPGLNGYWIEAKDLRVGDVFLGADGELSTLTNIVRVEQSGGIAVFNFEVEGNHNYFIIAKDDEFGQTCVLVHNVGCSKNNWSSGRHTPNNPAEEAAIQDVLDNPLIGKPMNIPLNDPYCPSGLGYVKYEYVKDKITIHYVMNTFENPPKPMDIKFKND